MKSPLLRRFSIASFITFFLLAVALSLVMSGFIKARVLDILARITGQYVQALLHSQVRAEATPEEHYAEMAWLFKQGALGEKIMGMKILEIRVWDTSGKIILSNNESIIGRQFPLTEKLKKALNGQVITEAVTLQKGETGTKGPSGDRAVKVYVPMKNSQGLVLGAYELYLDAPLVYRSMSGAYYMVGLTLLGGFVLVYVSLYRFFKSASQVIEQQSASMKALQIRLDAIHNEKQDIYLGTIKALLAALNAKDNYTADHSIRVADFALQIGEELGLSKDRLKLLEEAALFHDIGKIGIPEHILNKPDKLSPQELEQVKKHPIIGAQIIGVADTLMEHALIIRHHHERYDGNGYPDRLIGEDTPLESRILAVADTYDALVSERPYRRGLSTFEAVEVLRRCRGSQLDPQVVEAFLAVLARQGPSERRDTRISQAQLLKYSNQLFLSV